MANSMMAPAAKQPITEAAVSHRLAMCVGIVRSSLTNRISQYHEPERAFVDAAEPEEYHLEGR